MGKKVFVIDLSICNGCYTCQFACKDEHCGNDWSPIAKSQPEIGQFWVKLTEEVRGTVPKVKVAYRPHMCMHCDNPACMSACPVDDAVYKREDGLVVIDSDKCTGCRNCMDACPYDVIYFNEDVNIAQKCTGCAHLLDNGWTEPRCVDACPTLALKFMDEDEAKDLIADSQVLKPELKDTSKPRVYYQNMPGKFIAGTLYDPEQEEVIIGAVATLKDSAGASKTIETDSYGDFWFEGLDKGVFDLELESNGKVASFTGLDTTEKDLNLGDIPLV